MDANQTPYHVANLSAGFPKVVHNFIMNMQESAVHLNAIVETSEAQERENIEEEYPIEKSARILDYIDIQDTKDPFCIICDFEMPGKAVKNHLSEECHKNAFVIYGCKNIVQKGNTYHCKICDFEIPTIERVYRHIKLVKHLSAVNKKNASIEDAKKSQKQNRRNSIPDENLLSCIYIKKSDDKKYFCQICAEGGLFVWYKSLNFHITSKSHKEALVKYACDNIVADGMKKYFCKCCNFKFSGKKLFWHVKSDEHLRNVGRERSEGKFNKKAEKPIKEMSLVPPKNVEKTVSNDEVSQIWLSPIFFCRYIAQKTGMRYYCQICGDTRFQIFQPDVNDHIKGNQHQESLKKYGCDSIIFKENELYYCRLCKCEIADRDMVYVHIKNEIHLILVENFHCQNEETIKTPELPNFKENNKTYTSSREKKARLQPVKSEKSEENDQPMIKEKKAENVFETVAQFQRYVFIASLDDKTFFCRICEDRSLIDSKNVRNHSRGYEHKAALKKFGCDNIVPTDDNKFLCKCCQWELVSRQKACKHVKSKEHLRNAKKEKSKEEDNPSTSVERLIGSNSIGEEDLRVEKASKKATKPSNPSETKSCIYLQNLSQNIYHCRICDGTENIVYRKRLENHITGRPHNDSLRKYACHSIIHKGKSNYYCNRCDCKITDLEEVYLHVRDEKHWSSPKVPYCQNMISNFVLEESTLETEDDAEDNDSRIAVEEDSSEKTVNRSNEQPDRDFSLHYISSDPDVLGKGEIAKLMKPFAMRITKQRVNSPYCLICDYEISEYAAVDDHIMGKCHAKSLVTYGCDNIVRMDKGKFRCISCPRGMNGIESVYRHIKTKGHLKRIHPGEINDQYYKTALATISMAEGTKERLEVRQQAGDAQDQKPAEFNTIVSSLSADLSRMLASLKVDPTTKEKKKKKKAESKVNPRKMRFKETSPDREDGFSCGVCDITFPRKGDLHSHMTSHFSVDFDDTAKDTSDGSIDRNCRKNKEKFFTSDRRKFPTSFVDDIAADHCLAAANNLSNHDESSIVEELISRYSFR